MLFVRAQHYLDQAAFLPLARRSAVGQILRLSKAVLIADQIIALGVLGVVIGTRALEIDGKLCAFLGGLNLRLAVIGVLDDGDIAFLDLFVLLHGFAVIVGDNRVAGRLFIFYNRLHKRR